MPPSINDLVWIDSAGYHYADYPTFLAFYQAGYRAIYGADTYLGSDSQDGQWVAVQAQAAYDEAAKGAMTYSSFAPPTAQGTGLSRLVKLSGIKRNNPGFSTVDLTLGGTAGTAIVGGIATDALGQQWAVPNTVIPGPGTIVVTATATIKGALSAQPNTITSIFTPTRGWQTVNNLAAATPGSAVESDGTLRQRQAASTALPSQTVFEATQGAVANVLGVTNVKGYENDTDVVDGNGQPANSIALVVVGGTDVNVATAIRIKKTPGTKTFGTTNVPLVDSKGVPITINFFRPTNAEIGVQVTIAELNGWTNDYLTLIQSAVSKAVLSVPIGGPVILTKLFLAAYLPSTVAFGTFNVVSILIEKNGGGFAGVDIQLGYIEVPTCDPSTDVVIIP